MEKLYTTEEAGSILQVHPRTVVRYIQEGHLSARRLPGGIYRITISDLERMLREGEGADKELALSTKGEGN